MKKISLKKTLLLMCVIGVVVCLFGSVALATQNNDSIKYWKEISFDSSSIYLVPDVWHAGGPYNRLRKVIIYAETCIVEDADVVIIKCSDGKPLIILE